VAAWVSLLACLAIAAAKDDPLANLRTIYEREQADIARRHVEQRNRQWAPRYETALQQLLTEIQARGDLEAWTATNAELRRFRGKRNLSAANVVATTPELADLQIKALDQRRECDREKAEAIIKLQTLYESRLNQLVMSYVRANDLERAKAARDEATRSAALPAVSAARFALAVADTGSPSPLKSAPPPKVTKIPPPSGITIQSAERPTMLGASGYKRGDIYATGAADPSAPPPTVELRKVTGTTQGVYQTQLQFIITCRKPLPAGCVADIRLCGKPAATYRGYYRVWDGMRYRYTSPADRGAFAYSVAENFTFSLPALDGPGKPVIIDVKAVPDMTQSTWHGQEFTGCIFSIFAPDARLVYQGATLGSLKAFAPKALKDVQGAKP
jgi:DNA-binding protein H-NS